MLRNAQRRTGESRVLGFIGGFHLMGGLFEAIVPATVAHVAAIGVERLSPPTAPAGPRPLHQLEGHPTRRRTTLPDAFVQPSVGTTRFEAVAV